jgi:hypothetical protein
MSDTDYGQESHDLEAGDQQYGHEAFDNEHDNALSQSQFGAAQEHELDQHFEHARHVEYDDGHGGHYEVTEYTVVDVHEESSEQAFGQQVGEADHGQVNEEQSFDAIEYLHEHLSSSFSEFGDNFGKIGDLAHVGEIGHGSDFSGDDFGLNAASNSGGDDTGFGELSAASN